MRGTPAAPPRPAPPRPTRPATAVRRLCTLHRLSRLADHRINIRCCPYRDQHTGLPTRRLYFKIKPKRKGRTRTWRCKCGLIKGRGYANYAGILKTGSGSDPRAERGAVWWAAETHRVDISPSRPDPAGEAAKLGEATQPDAHHAFPRCQLPGTKNCRINVRFSPNMSARGEGDSRRMSRVYNNTINNKDRAGHTGAHGRPRPERPLHGPPRPARPAPAAPCRRATYGT